MLQATNVQIFPGTTARLIAAGPQSPGDMEVQMLQTIGAGPVNLGGSAVNASLGLPWASAAAPHRIVLGQGDDLYAGAVASVMVVVLRTKT